MVGNDANETVPTVTGDPNMDTIHKWSKDFPGLVSLYPAIEKNYCKLVEIIEAVEECVGQEFYED